jgi:hypothetical protein
MRLNYITIPIIILFFCWGSLATTSNAYDFYLWVDAYPVPATNYLTIRFYTDFKVSKEAKLILYDMLGKEKLNLSDKIYQFSNDHKSEFTVSIAAIQQGVYTLVASNAKRIMTQRVIVIR